MRLNFKFSQTRIRNVCHELIDKVDLYFENEISDKQQHTSEKSIQNTDAPNILPRILRYFSQHDDLQLVTGDKKRLDGAISATFPLINRIIILKEEYNQIRFSDSFWLPAIITHEIGHWVLHAPVFKQFRRQLDLFEDCKICSSFDEITDLHPSDLNLFDQQANHFARELLLPEDKIQKALQQLGYYPPVIYREHHLNLMPFEEYCTRLAEKAHAVLQVPIPWLHFRMLELNIVQNRATTETVIQTS